MATHQISVTINGAEHHAEVESRLLLVHFIRDEVRLTGTHIGCDTTHCGACTILMDGTPVKSCTILTVQADGAEIKTVEGLAENGKLHPLQEGFWEKHGLQCGYCTPGMLMTSSALLESNPSPTEQEIREAISGNLCRCTGYVNIIKAVQHAADTMASEAGANASEESADASEEAADTSEGAADASEEAADASKEAANASEEGGN